MTPNQLCDLSSQIIRELSPRAFEMVKHYIYLEATQPHRPDYGNLMNALNTSQTYAGLGWELTNIEIAHLEYSILEMVKVRS